MPAVSYASNWNLHHHDANGHPALGWLVYSFVSGDTSTPLDTYQDPAGTVKNANPIVLNARGEYPGMGLFLINGASYTLELRTPADITVITSDKVIGLSASSGQPVGTPTHYALFGSSGYIGDGSIIEVGGIPYVGSVSAPNRIAKISDLGAGSYLKLDCSNGPLTGTLGFTDGTVTGSLSPSELYLSGTGGDVRLTAGTSGGPDSSLAIEDVHGGLYITTVQGLDLYVDAHNSTYGVSNIYLHSETIGSTNVYVHIDVGVEPEVYLSNGNVTAILNAGATTAELNLFNSTTGKNVIISSDGGVNNSSSAHNSNLTDVDLQFDGVSISSIYSPIAGSSSIATVGIIGAGTWHGTAITDTYISSASTWNAKLGTVTADTTSRTANTVYAAPNGSAGAATFRTLVAADIPSLSGVYLPLIGGTVSGTGGLTTNITSGTANPLDIQFNGSSLYSFSYQGKITGNINSGLAGTVWDIKYNSNNFLKLDSTGSVRTAYQSAAAGSYVGYEIWNTTSVMQALRVYSSTYATSAVQSRAAWVGSTQTDATNGMAVWFPTGSFDLVAGSGTKVGSWDQSGNYTTTGSVTTATPSTSVQALIIPNGVQATAPTAGSIITTSTAATGLQYYTAAAWHTVCDLSTAQTLTAAKTTATPATGQEALIIPHGAAPTAPTNGSVWTTATAATGVQWRINGATVTMCDLATAQTLASKTLTSPTINGAALSGTLSGAHTVSGTATFSAAFTASATANAFTNTTDITIGTLTTGSAYFSGGISIAKTIQAKGISFGMGSSSSTSGTINVDVSQGSIFQCTAAITGATTFNIQNVNAGCIYWIHYTQNSTGSAITLTFPTSLAYIEESGTTHAVSSTTSITLNGGKTASTIYTLRVSLPASTRASISIM